MASATAATPADCIKAVQTYVSKILKPRDKAKEISVRAARSDCRGGAAALSRARHLAHPRARPSSRLSPPRPRRA